MFSTEKTLKGKLFVIKKEYHFHVDLYKLCYTLFVLKFGKSRVTQRLACNFSVDLFPLKNCCYFCNLKICLEIYHFK